MLESFGILRKNSQSSSHFECAFGPPLILLQTRNNTFRQLDACILRLECKKKKLQLLTEKKYLLERLIIRNKRAENTQVEELDLCSGIRLPLQKMLQFTTAINIRSSKFNLTAPFISLRQSCFWCVLCRDIQGVYLTMDCCTCLKVDSTSELNLLDSSKVISLLLPS
jgi:hypothetical protein